MNNELPQVGSQKTPTPATVATSAAARGDMPPASAVLPSQTSGDGTEALVRECASRIDDALAPLVAAGIVKPGLAAILTGSLRIGIKEVCGEPFANTLLFIRTLKAVQTLRSPTAELEEIGGA